MKEQQKNTDAFLQIAQQARASSEGLCEPRPLPMGHTLRFELKESSRPVRLPSMGRDDGWFDSELERLHNVWEPFLSNFAPALESRRQVVELRDFHWRLDCDACPQRLPDAMAGRGDWEAVTVPHYGGPIGRATAFYRSVFPVDPVDNGNRQWIRFEGVDYIAKVYLNGNYIGQHEGLVGAFEFDVTDYLLGGAENTLLVQVENDAICMGNDMWDSKEAGDKIYAATGPGWDDPEIGWHHCPPGMGIYRTVSLESRPELFIEDGWVRPIRKESAIEFWLEVHANEAIEGELQAHIGIHGKNFDEVALPERAVALKGAPGRGRNYYRLRLDLPEARLWSPDTPWLYSLQVRIGDDAQEFVFGMREFRMEEDAEPKGRLYLNDRPVRLRGINTMGHEQICVMRGDSDQLLNDLLIYKMAGINYIRFTQRPVEREVYALCDALGLLVQADLPLFKHLRRNQFNEAVRQASEMERFVRRHPSVVITSFFNEPFPLSWHYALQRHLSKHELDLFYQSASTAVLQENPDRVIKPVDGDYDPPSAGLPDNHCYALWYNGHMIPFGKIEAGYWQPVKPGWNYACGEFGAEGLDPVDLMRRRYPSDWLPQPGEEEKDWTPRRIRKAQSGDMYQVFYDKPETIEGWVKASQDFQAWSITQMAEAFRRDPRMVGFALHLGIDAFPSGWMKTIVDCERRPKKGFFAYRDALAPVLPTLRAPRRFWWSGEIYEAELWLSNDLPEEQEKLQVLAELYVGDQLFSTLNADLPVLAAADSMGVGKLTACLPETSDRMNCVLCLQVVSPEGKLLGEGRHEFSIFKRDGTLPSWKAESALSPGVLSRVKAGETVVLGPLPIGKHTIDGMEFEIAPVGMGELMFCSRATGHALVEGFEPNDFRLWYDDSVGYASDFADSVIVGNGLEPVLLAGRGGFGEAWTPTPVVAERKIGKGRLIICQLKLTGRVEKNPPAAIFAGRLMKFHG